MLFNNRKIAHLNAAITDAEGETARLRRELSAAVTRLNEANGKLIVADRRLEAASKLALTRGKTLREIAGMETPGANATVRRMARKAREAV